MSKKKRHETDAAGEIEAALTRSEQFIEKNQRYLMYAFVALIAVVTIYLGYDRVYMKNREEAARSEMFMAERYFQRDSFNLALNGTGSYPGVLAIIDDYGNTKSANLAHYYAGMSYLQMAQYDNAIKYLKRFDGGDMALGPIATGALGDSYWEKGDASEAADYYSEAAKMRDNEFTSPIYLLRAALAYEANGELEDAMDALQDLKKDYPASREAREADKYIARLKQKMS